MNCSIPQTLTNSVYLKNLISHNLEIQNMVFFGQQHLLFFLWNAEYINLLGIMKMWEGKVTLCFIDKYKQWQGVVSTSFIILGDTSSIQTPLYTIMSQTASRFVSLLVSCLPTLSPDSLQEVTWWAWEEEGREVKEWRENWKTCFWCCSVHPPNCQS